MTTSTKRALSRNSTSWVMRKLQRSAPALNVRILPALYLPRPSLLSRSDGRSQVDAAAADVATAGVSAERGHARASVNCGGDSHSAGLGRGKKETARERAGSGGERRKRRQRDVLQEPTLFVPVAVTTRAIARRVCQI